MVDLQVYDLDAEVVSYKTITTRLVSFVPSGNEGDEEWIISFATDAYSNIANATEINNMYIRSIKFGWIKSSGLVGIGSKFTLTDSSNKLKIKLDNSIGPVGNGGYYTIELDTGINLIGSVIAKDIEDKIKAIPSSGVWNANDDTYKPSYLNCSVEYKEGKFWIVSGASTFFYTGDNRSSVDVVKVNGDGCFETLGFNLSISSEDISNLNINETLLAENYTHDTTPIIISTSIGINEGDALFITDGINSDYFTAITVSGTNVGVSTNGVNSHTGISHDYILGKSKIQHLKWQDPDKVPTIYHDSIDKVVRFGIDYITNQIEF